MFTRARIKLTVWYLLIIMLISIMFSLSIYHILTGELQRGFNRISQRYAHEFGTTIAPIHPEILEPAYLQASEERIRLTLLYINIIIFGVSGIGGYILAGITLKPIRIMIDEQNQFVQDASHELRTPLTSLKSEVEVYMRAKQHGEKETRALLESNLEEINNLQVLSDNLIALAYYQNPPSKKYQTPVVLSSVMERAIKKLQKQAKQKQITMKQHVPVLTVLGSGEQLEQLFGVLLDNAIKYSPQKSAITISAEKIDGLVKVSVQDTGIGIDEKDMPHIFDRFYRADNSRTKQEISGYGLGLSIAKQIVKQHHGSIAVKSVVGQGTTFVITLPIQAA